MGYIPRMNRERYPSALAFAREMGMPYKKVLDMCHAGQLPHLPFDKNLKQPKIWIDKDRYLADEEKILYGGGFSREEKQPYSEPVEDMPKPRTRSVRPRVRHSEEGTDDFLTALESLLN